MNRHPSLDFCPLSLTLKAQNEAGVFYYLVVRKLIMSYWIKLYTDNLNDRAYQRLSDSAFRSIINMSLMASLESERDGRLPSVRDMAFDMRIEAEQLRSDLSELEAEGLVEMVDGQPFLVRFQKEQSAKTSAERQRAYRARKRDSSREGNETSNEGVTERNARRYQDRDIDRDIDIDKDIDKDKKRKKEKYPLPSGFEFPSELKQSQAFMTVWDDWEKHRRELKRTLNPTTRKSQLKKARGYDIGDAIWVIEQSIENGWQGLFWDKLDKKQAQTSGGGSWKL